MAKVDKYVTTEAAPEPQPNYGGAIATKAQKVIKRQIEGAVSDIKVIEEVRDVAIDRLAERIGQLVNPELFTADLYDRVARNVSGQSLAYEPIFRQLPMMEIESIRLPIKERPSVSDFLALPAGESGGLSGYAPLAIEGGDYADD